MATNKIKATNERPEDKSASWKWQDVPGSQRKAGVDKRTTDLIDRVQADETMDQEIKESHLSMLRQRMNSNGVTSCLKTSKKDGSLAIVINGLGGNTNKMGLFMTLPTARDLLAHVDFIRKSVEIAERLVGENAE